MTKKNYEIVPVTDSVVVIKEQNGVSWNGVTHAFLQVSAEFDYDTFEVKEYTFGVITNMKDHYPRYTSEERALWSVTPESLEMAKKTLEKNLKKIKSEMRKGKKHPAYSEMKEMVEAYVKHYHDDFYKIDTHILGRYNPTKFVWIVRDCGTNMMYSQVSKEANLGDVKYHGMNSSNRIFYYEEGKGLNQVSYETALSIIENDQL